MHTHPYPQNNFARVGSFLKCIFSHSLWNAMERKTVRLSLEPNTASSTVRQLLEAGGDGEGPGGGYYSASSKEEEFRTDDSTRDYIAPTICALCANSIAAVSHSVDSNYSQLLLTMMRSVPTLI